MSDSDSQSSGPPIVPKGGSNKSAKWIAVVVVIVVVIAGSVAYFELFANNKTATPSISASSTAIVGTPYNFTIKESSKFTSMTVYFGDGTSTNVSYNGSSSYTVSHTYKQPGSAIVYFTITTSKGTTGYPSQLFPVSVSPSSSYVSSSESLGTITYNVSQSSTPLVANQTMFKPGSFLSMVFGYYTEPSSSGYTIVSQAATVNMMGSTLKSMKMPYAWNSTKGAYQPPSSQNLNYTFASSGLYVVNLNTTTEKVTNTTTGALDSSTSQTTKVFLDVAVFSNAKVGTSVSGTQPTILTNNELEVGGISSLDPAVAFDTVSLEPIYNTMLPLVGFNGSSTSSFIPMLSKNVPSVSNGGINDNFANYTTTYTQANGNTVTYAVNVTPYENYTFQIRSNATWQNGQPVTAWDVGYGLARILLYDAGSPLTGGWMIAPYYLPGNPYADNSFYNITHNMTIDNKTNSITLHFKNPMTPPEIFGLLSYYRYASASWLSAHGAGLSWTPAGFQAYKAHAKESNYFTYPQYHILSDGPYQLSYTVPGTEVVLVKNNNYNPPAYGMPKAKIDQVDLKYISSPSTTYLNLKSGAAQISTIPTNSWNEVNSLQNAGIAKAYSFPTPDVFFYKFNTQVNTTGTKALGDSSVNMPADLFTSENARKAFSYAYNYSYFLNYQVGNKVFGATFAQLYAGYLETGVTFAQNYSEMQKVAQVPTYDIAKAKQFWNTFVNGSEGANASVSYSGGVDLFNGHTLNIPIFVQSADPVDLEGATTWAQSMEKVIPGLTMPVITLPFTQIIGESAVVAKNPLTIFWYGLAPAYAYPTDSVGGSEMPVSTGHLGGENITPAWFASSQNTLHNATQSAQLQQLIYWYQNATSTFNTNSAEHYFHMINEQFVNMSLIVFTEQVYQYHIISTKLSQNVVVPYEENGLIGNDMYYNFFSYP